MAEYIEREALKDVFQRYLNMSHVQTGHMIGQGMRIAIKSCIELLDNERAADVAPVVHGRWELEAHDKMCYSLWVVRAECSNCHAEKTKVYDGCITGFGEAGGDVAIKQAVKFLKPYCPNCGARMDGE